MGNYEEAAGILAGRFGKDSIIAVATVKDGRPYVRNVDGYYEDGAFYAVTYALSEKMAHIGENPDVAVCGEWFTARGKGENMGHVLEGKNNGMMAKLRLAFASWYTGGHVSEEDPNTCLLRVRLESGVLFNEGKRYAIDFIKKEALS